MEKTRSLGVPVLVGLCGGIAIGVLVTLVLTRRPPDTSGRSWVELQEQISLIEVNVKALNEKLELVEHRIDDSRSGSPESSSARADQQGPARQPIEPAPELRGGAVGDSSQWVTVLDKDIARVLVERGLTPFDSKVADRLRQAGDDLRSVDSEYSATVSTIQAQLENQQIGPDENLRLCRLAQDQHRKQRKVVLDQLGTALDSR